MEPDNKIKSIKIDPLADLEFNQPKAINIKEIKKGFI